MTKEQIIDFAWDEAYTINRTYSTPTNFSLQQIDEVMDRVSDQLKGHNYLSRGLYAMQLARWFRRGLGEDMLIIPYPELEFHPEKVYSRVLEFAGMPSHALSQEILSEKFNFNDAITEPISTSTRQQLTTFFENSRAELVDLLKSHNKSQEWDWRTL